MDFTPTLIIQIAILLVLCRIGIQVENIKNKLK